MTLVMANLPIALLVAVMTVTWPRRWLPLPAHVALPGVAVLAYGLRFIQPDDAAPAIIHAAVIDGVLSSLTPLAIVFGAVLLFKTMDKSGAMACWRRGCGNSGPTRSPNSCSSAGTFHFSLKG